MLLSIKWLVCVVTVILAWSETNAFPSVWKREVSLSGSSYATEILESLDKSVDPCDDFYMFACGGWKEKHPVSNDTPSVHIDSVLSKYLSEEFKLTLEEPISEDDISPLKAAKKMYQVCMDVETIERAGIQPLVDLSNELGGWPMTLEHWDEGYFSVEDNLAEFDRRLGWSPLFRTYNYLSVNGSSRLLVYINGNPENVPSFNLIDSDYEKKQSEYVNSIVNTSIAIMNATGVNIEAETVFQQSRDIFDFMTQLQYIKPKNASREDITLKELQEWTDSALVANTSSRFNWLSYLNKILFDTDIVLDENEEVRVFYKEYLFELVKLLDVTPRRVLANYFQWVLIDVLNKKTKLGINDFSVPAEKIPPRSTYCREVTMERFNHVVNSRLVQKTLNKRDKESLRRLVETIRSNYLNLISNDDWLDEDARSLVRKKVETIRMHMGYPDMYNDEMALVEYYKQVNVSDVHFFNMLITETESLQRSLNRLRDNVNEDHIWDHFRPETLQVFYSSSDHQIIISFVILLPYYFAADRLDFLNYGRIGMVIGHEITHAIVAAFKSDFSNDTRANLMVRRHCFIDQYNSYHIQELEKHSETNVTVDGEKTAEENIADFGGLNAAYDTYKSRTSSMHQYRETRLPGLEEYSQDQLFFIGYATSWCESRTSDSMKQIFSNDEHSPKFARVRGSVSNMEQFATAFNCPAGSNMNPVNKCRIL